ncbi:MAG TPA: cupredoxin domain-containing protein [Opitutaceae bacterium]|nr:cupredoxin domain-containing protein [Opitutaceae bacterium]
MRSKILTTILIVVLLLINLQWLEAENATPITIEIHFAQHHFSPDKVEVQAGRPVEIRVTNSSRERIEFESFKLNREKVVDPGQTIVVRLPALRAGSYDFFDDFHDDVPEGVIVAR